MPNLSKVKDLRFWKRWIVSGAVGTVYQKKTLAISSKWTGKERFRLLSAIKAKKREIDNKVRQAKKTIKYAAPCFQEWARKRQAYEELIYMLERASSRFLENNRTNYAEFISH